MTLPSLVQPGAQEEPAVPEDALDATDRETGVLQRLGVLGPTEETMAVDLGEVPMPVSWSATT